MIKPLFRVLLGLVCEDLNDAFIQTSSRNTLRFFNCFLHCFKLAKSLKLGHEQAIQNMFAYKKSALDFRLNFAA